MAAALAGMKGVVLYNGLALGRFEWTSGEGVEEQGDQERYGQEEQHRQDLQALEEDQDQQKNVDGFQLQDRPEERIAV